MFSVVLLCGYFFLSISTTAMAMIAAIAAPIVYVSYGGSVSGVGVGVAAGASETTMAVSEYEA